MLKIHQLVFIVFLGKRKHHLLVSHLTTTTKNQFELEKSFFQIHKKCLFLRKNRWHATKQHFIFSSSFLNLLFLFWFLFYVTCLNITVAYTYCSPPKPSKNMARWNLQHESMKSRSTFQWCFKPDMGKFFVCTQDFK